MESTSLGVVVGGTGQSKLLQILRRRRRKCQSTEGDGPSKQNELEAHDEEDNNSQRRNIVMAAAEAGCRGQSQRGT
nr:CIC_HP1_G0027400.mRNA.1.CDS.1 [Saccharomyces cerevisiae]